MRNAIMKHLLGKDVIFAGFVEMGSHMSRMLEFLQPNLVVLELTLDSKKAFASIETIMAKYPIPIVVISSDRSNEVAVEAISRGALEVMTLADVLSKPPGQFLHRLKLIGAVKVIRHRQRTTSSRESERKPAYGMVAIAASTGGPKAVLRILKALPSPFPVPIVIVQHIGLGFVEGMATWLRDVTGLDVSVAKPGDCPKDGGLYLAPDHAHLAIGEGGFELHRYNDKDIYRPSCDRLLESVAKMHGPASIGVVLTGMGDDGALGLAAVKSVGGLTIAQDEATSVVFGMPRRAIEIQAAQFVLPIDDIAEKLSSALGVP